MIFMSPLHCETQAARENIFFTVPVITSRMFQDFISVPGAFGKAKTQVTSICTLFFYFSN